MDIKELTSIVKEKGVAGAGGAGFPTYAKFDKRTDTIILNCAECEPLLKVHRQLLEKYPFEIMTALNLIATAVNAKQIVIAVKKGYKKTIEAVKSYHESFPSIELKLLPEVYPMGDEVVLTYEVTGKVIPPGSIPIEVGVTVFNVETVLNIYKAVMQDEPVSTKYLTIVGEVNKPTTVKVPIGMSVQEVLTLAGDVIIKEPIYIMGGPMTGKIVNPYDTITKTTNAIIVLPKEHYVIRKLLSNTSIDMKRAMSVCCQCAMCTDLCPRHQLGLPITPNMFMRGVTSGVTKDISTYVNTMFCCGCGICEMYACPQELSPRKLITEYKNGLRKNGVAMPKGIPLKEVDGMREYRKIPMERLIKRLGLHNYDLDAPIVDEDVSINQVKISFGQHIGAKPKAIVKRGDKVYAGEKIAVAEEGALSMPIHASISGVIKDINTEFIIINREVVK